MPSLDAAGTELYYERSGAGEPLLMIQGMSATHLTWGRPFLDELEGSFECVVFDNRGIGRSGMAEMPFTTADMAADTAALIDALGLESVHVLGISMGGMIAQELALAQPERIRSLTLGATYCGGPNGTLMAPEDLKMLGEAMSSGERDRVHRAMWEINLSPGFRAEESRYDAFVEMATALRAALPVIVQQMRACGAHDTSARLGGVSLPTLVVHGDEDRLLAPGNGREVAALIPGARLEMLEGVGHMFWWERPSEAAALVREHALAPV